MPHDLLFQTLKSYGVESGTLEWIADSYTGRVQVVTVSGQKSEPSPMTCGVFPGESSAQTFFILFINRVLDRLKHAKGHLFADDLQLYLYICRDWLIMSVRR